MISNRIGNTTRIHEYKNNIFLISLYNSKLFQNLLTVLRFLFLPVARGYQYFTVIHSRMWEGLHHRRCTWLALGMSSNLLTCA